jgi:hypothetical protein
VSDAGPFASGLNVTVTGCCPPLGMSKVPLPLTPNGGASIGIFTRKLNLPEFFTLSGKGLVKLTVTLPKLRWLVAMRIRPNGGVGVAVGVRVGVAVADAVAVGVIVAVAVGVIVGVAVGVTLLEVAVGDGDVVDVGVGLVVEVAVAVGVADAVAVALGVGDAVGDGVGDGAGPIRAFAIQVPQLMDVPIVAYSAASQITL